MSTVNVTVTIARPPYEVALKAGDDRASAISDAINHLAARARETGIRHRLVTDPGRFTIEAPIVVQPNTSNLELDFSASDFVPAAGWAGDADDPENVMIKLAGEAVGDALPLATDLKRGTRTIEVDGDVPEEWAVGDWLLVKGINDPVLGTAGEYNSSDGTLIEFAELLKIQAIDGSEVTTVGRARQHHEAGGTSTVTVQKYKPIENVRVDMPRIPAASDGALAVGLLGRGCVGLTVDVGAGMSGASRAIVNLDDGTRGRVLNAHNLGGSNCVVYCDSAHDVKVHGLYVEPDGDRCHELGVKRYAVVRVGGCTGVELWDFEIQNMTGGVRDWGGERNSTVCGTMYDLGDPGAACGWAASMAAAGEVFSPGRFGVAIDVGAGPLEFGSRARFLRISDVDVSECVTADDQMLVYWHDHSNSELSGCTFTNRSGDPCRGIYLGDNFGSVASDLVFSGIDRCIQIAQGGGQCSISHVSVEATDASGVTHGPVLYLDYGTPGFQVEIDDLRVSNATSFVTFGPAFADYALRLNNFKFASGLMFSDVWVARNDTDPAVQSSLREVWEIDPDSDAGTRQLQVPDGTGTPVIIVSTYPFGDLGHGWVFISPIGVGVGSVAVDGTAAPGDKLVWAGVGQPHKLTVDNDATDWLARATTHSSAGYVSTGPR